MLFDSVATKTDLTSITGPLTPVADNPDFPPGVGDRMFQTTDPSLPLAMKDCFLKGSFKTLAALKSGEGFPDLSWWQYFQLHDYATKNPRKLSFIRKLTELERVCAGRSSVANATSVTYTWLQDVMTTADDRFRQKWSSDLHTDFSDKQWKAACVLAHQGSISTKAQETSYKLLTQWYATPVKLKKWYPHTSDCCWRCKAEMGSLIHIWWECPVLSEFWNRVREAVKLITDTTMVLDAAMLPTTYL